MVPRKSFLTYFTVALILLATIQYSVCLTIYNAKFSSKDIYSTLLNLRLDKLSKVYGKNSSLPGYEIYMEIVNGSYTDFPIYSWLLLIDCERMLFSSNITIMVKNLGENETAYVMMNIIKQKFQYLEEELQKISPKTIACVEWLSFADRNYNYGRDYLFSANKKYSEGRFSGSLIFLIQLYISLCRAEDELRIAFKRNNISATIREFSKIENAMKKLALNLINEVDNNFKDVENIKRPEFVNHSKELLSTAKEYFNNGSYYFALMYSAEAKTTLEYAHFSVPTNRSSVLKQAEKFIKWAEKNLTKIYLNVEVDAPLAEYNYELARLYLKDAKIEEDKNTAILLADAAIHYALTAAEQAKQTLRIIGQIESLENVGRNRGKPWWEKISIWDLVAFVGGLVVIPVAIYLIFIKFGRRIFMFRRGRRRK